MKRIYVLFAFITTLFISACGGGGSTAPAATAPAAPAGVTIAAGNSKVTPNWTADAGATSYNVYYRTSAGVTVANGTKVANAAAGTAITGLVNGTTYFVAVTAVNAVGESALSTEVSAMPALPAPSGVAVAAGNNQITATWTAVTGATSYNLYYGTAAGVTTASPTKVIGATSGTAITGLVNGTKYYVVVTSVGATGESVVSGEVNATPVAPPPPPSAPTITSFTPTSGSQGTLVTVIGAGFDTSGTNTITLTGPLGGTTWVAANIAGATSTSIQFTIPTSAQLGVNTVSVANAIGNSPTFGALIVNVYVPPPSQPTLTSFAPNTGSAGEPVILSGANFGLVPANVTVKFNGTQAIVTAANSSFLTVLVPSLATSGPITVSTAAGSATSTTNFISQEVTANSPIGLFAESGRGGALPYTAASPGQVNLTWTPVAGATSYNVYSKLMGNGSNIGQVISTPSKVGIVTSPPFVHVGLTLGAAYAYRVSAMVGGVESFSSPAFSVPTNCPSELGCLSPIPMNAGLMVTKRMQHTSIRLNDGKVLILGGGGGAGSSSISAEIFNPIVYNGPNSYGQYIATGSMLTARLKPDALILPDGKVLVGCGGAGFEIYDPTTGTFSATGNTVMPGCVHLTSLANGKVLATGMLGQAEIYNPATGTFSLTGNMLFSRLASASMPMDGREGFTVTLLANGKVLVTGGKTVGALNSAEIYDPATGTFAATGNMNSPRYNHKALLLTSGKVLISGGSNNLGAYPGSFELFDPVTGIFSVPADSGGAAIGMGFACPLNTLSSDHSTTLLTDGRVFITGFCSTSYTGVNGTTEYFKVFDPNPISPTLGTPMPLAQVSTPVNSRANGRPYTSATLLNFLGGVLISGGGLLAQDEIFVP